MTEYEVNQVNGTIVDIKNAIVKHDNESDFLTFSCKNCGEQLGIYIGIENLVLLNKLVSNHSCENI